MEQKSGWDKFADGVSEFAEGVGAVASDLYNKGKDSAQKAKLRNELRDCYRYLGELSYRSRKGESEDHARIGELVARIDDLLARLASFDAEAK